jgi:DNA-binding MurR/RpiR family transcriptional regulator
MKLGNRLLEIMNESSLDSTNWMIASTVLKLGPKIEFTSSKDLAEKCHVSEATISRFVKRIGYSNYGILKQHAHSITEPNMTQMFHMSAESLNLIKSKPNIYLENYSSLIANSLNDLKDSIDHEKIDSLLHSIHKSKRIFVFSCSTSLMLGQIVQSTLVNHGKVVSMGFDEQQQQALISHINSDDLVIIISVFGNFIHDNLETVQKLTNVASPKVLITQNPGVQETYYFDQVVYLTKKNHNESGFYCMLFGIEYLIRKYSLLFGT